MNADIKARWVAALRSGEYEQGRGLLHPTEESYCCLGVLCELHRLAVGTDDWVDVTYYGGHHETLPSFVAKWAGLDDSNPSIQVGRQAFATLAELNDGGDGNSALYFDEIADLIEREL